MRIISIAIVLLFMFAASVTNLQAQSDTTKPKAKKSSYVMSKSPGGAIWRSLAVPGWGQLYVESYWKAPIFFVGAGTLIYLIIDNQIKFADYDRRTSKMARTDPDYNMAKLYREYYRDNRDMSGFYLLAVYILGTVDAYVGAHLYDFQVDDNLSMSIGISSVPVPAVGIKIRF
jgi:hypothetical protein